MDGLLYEWVGCGMNGQIQVGAIRPKKYFFYVAFFLGLLFALISQEGFFRQLYSDGPMLILLNVLFFIHWQFESLALVAFMILSHKLLSCWRYFEHSNPWFALTISGMVACTLYAPLGFAADALWGLEDNFNEWGSGLIEEWRGLVLPATIAWIAMNAPWLLGFRLQRTHTETKKHKESVAIAQLPYFMKLVPEETRGKLVYLKAELHYLKVITDKGSALILYNLRDAIQEYGEALGVHCHRSFWVVKIQVVQFTKLGRQGSLKMSNLETVPVSRRNMEKFIS